MRKTYWKEYYRQNKKKLKIKRDEWLSKNPEKIKEYRQRYRDKNNENYKGRAREYYKKWIQIKKNRKHKKDYQKVWWRYRKEEREELNSLLKTLINGKAKINGYDVEIKSDKGGKWFYFLVQDKRIVYMSDKFETKIDAVKDLEYAI